MASRHFEFLQPVATALDLELPRAEPDDYEGQLFDLKVGDRFTILTADKRRYSEVIFKEWMQLTIDSNKMAIFQRLENSELIPITNAVIGRLEKHGRIVPVNGDGSRHMPGSSLALSDEDLAVTDRAMEYVDAIYLLWEERGSNNVPVELTMEVIEAVAARRNEPPPTYGWVRKQIISDANGSSFDRRMNFAPKPKRGNEKPRKSAIFYEALTEAVQLAWSIKNGTWKTARDELRRLVLEDESFLGARDEVLDAKGRVLIHKSTFSAHKRDVDKYTQDLLRYGPDGAELRNKNFVRRNRPEGLLDIVDVDHLDPDIVAYDERNPLVFGRVDIVAVRERLSGAYLGYGISFGRPSFQTFLNAFEFSIFEKDKRRLATGVAWPWYGMPKKLGVDNALHFLKDSMDGLSKALRFRIVEHRPAKPMDKGALERSLGSMNREVMHGIPGSTMWSPQIRALFDKDENLAVPVISLGELHAVVQHWIANVHSRTPHEGLHGDLLTSKGIPAEIWDRELKGAPNRPMIDRTIFARLGGIRRKVTVQKDGIRCENIHYNAPSLSSIYLHPDNIRAQTGRENTKYDFTISANSVDTAWVVDPYLNRTIEVRAVETDAEYAKDMPFDTHKMVQKHRRKMEREAENDVTLLEARLDLHKTIMALIEKGRKKFDVVRLLARFVDRQGQYERHRQITELAKMREDGLLSFPGLHEDDDADDTASVVVHPLYPRDDEDEENAGIVPHNLESHPTKGNSAKKPTKAGPLEEPVQTHETHQHDADGSGDDLAARHPGWDDE
jgi:putative transposase